MASPIPPFGLRLPPDLKGWIEDQAKRYGGSQNAEIVRAVRERMERAKAATGQSLPAHPVAVSHDTALPGGPAIHGC